MGPFQDAIDYESKSVEEVEGRKTQRYQLSLDSDKILKSRSLKPFVLSGDVWIDQDSAVRILADVHGELKKGIYRKKIHLKLSRMKIGEEITFSSLNKKIEKGSNKP